jgi:hypothetical protein
MSGAVSNIHLGSSSSSSSSSATKVEKLIKKFDQTSVRSCVIGISKISLNNINNNFCHTALLLSDLKASKLEKEKNTVQGIVIEYGNYPPDEAKEKEIEQGFIDNGYVIYRYGKEGGLRYYVNDFKEFKKTFSDIGYICLDISRDNQISFSFLLNKIAPESEKKWIKANYKIKIFGQNCNCQNFTSHCLDIMKPKYDSRYISKGIEKVSKTEEDNESIIPDIVLNTLKKYEDD